MKNSNLRHSLACSQRKGLSKYQRRASWMWNGPSPRWKQRGRHGTARACRQGASSAPETSILHQTVSRLPVANQVFLGSWMADIHQKGRRQKSAPQKKHTAHLRWSSLCAPRKPSSWDGGGDKAHHPPGETAPAKDLVA